MAAANDRYRELQENEAFKAARCKRCPRCQRIIEKVRFVEMNIELHLMTT